MSKAFSLRPTVSVPSRPHQWKHLHAVAEHSSVVNTAMALVERGDLGREEALVAMVLALYNEQAHLWQMHMDLVNVQPARPMVIAKDGTWEPRQSPEAGETPKAD